MRYLKQNALLKKSAEGLICGLKVPFAAAPTTSVYPESQFVRELETLIALRRRAGQARPRRLARELETLIALPEEDPEDRKPQSARRATYRIPRKKKKKTPKGLLSKFKLDGIDRQANLSGTTSP